MINLYIDESGTMNCKNCQKFIISIVKIIDEKSLKIKFKRFVSKNMNLLKEVDKKNKMFKDDKFFELKGCALDANLKRKFVEYLIKYKDFELFLIEIDNAKVDEKFYRDKSRAFNYSIKLALEFFINKKYFPKNESYKIVIDERNVKVEAKRSLEDYLNTALMLDEKLTDEIKVEYHDSAHVRPIQIADFFANLCFSHSINNTYKESFFKMKKADILKCIFKFPLK